MPKQNSALSTQLLIAQDTHAGARGKNNEDSCDVFEVPLQGSASTPSPQPMTVAVVADGVTSRTGGAQASQIAVKSVRSLLEKGLVVGPRQKQLEEVILRANREIHTFAQTNAIMENMSTTMVLAAIEAQQLYVLHVGDSRAYLIRGLTVYQLTLDHTWVQRAIDEGRITPAEAKVHPNRHVIVRYLGIEQRVTVDQGIIIPDTTQPDGQRLLGDTLTLRPGDALLLCTDGLTDQVKDSEIAEAVRAHWLRPKEAIKKLINLALQRQEPDNITIVLLEVPDGPVPLALPVRKVTPLLVGLAVLLVGLLAIGGSFMANMVRQPNVTPQPAPIANTAAQAVAVATATALPPTNTPIAIAGAATPANSAAALPPTATNAPIAPTTALQSGAPQTGAALLPTLTATPNTPTAPQVATQVVAPTIAIAATQPLLATATLAPSPTATATNTPTPTPPVVIGLTAPPNGATVSSPATFQWSISPPNTQATFYRLLIWPVGQQNRAVEIKREAATNTSTNVDLNSAPGGTALVNNDSYNWQIQLISPAGGALARSAVGQFTYLAPTPTPTPAPTQPPPTQQQGDGNNNNNNDDDSVPTGP